MEFFNKAEVVRLRSHLDKFLVADDDEQTVRQSRNGSSRKARWAVEMVEGKSHVIRLRSCTSGKYLTPSDEPFLLGMTGKKVVQDTPANKRDPWVELEPIKEGELVKLRVKGGKFLRANWGTPPWRNSVTHDIPHRTATQDWILWGVDVVDTVVGLESQESFMSNLSPASSFSSVPDKRMVGADSGSISMVSNGSTYASRRQMGMEFFKRAKAVRLQSYHGKYLVADDDEETIRQSRNGSSTKARWIVEYIEGNPNAIRLKSCHNLYLSATKEPFILGMTGKKVRQYPPNTEPDCTTEWEPIKEGEIYIKLQTNEGKFLRANSGTPLWRNSVTHDIPHRTTTQDWVLWGVDVVDIVLSDNESVMSSLSSFSSVIDDYSSSPDTRSSILASSTTVHRPAKQGNDMVETSSKNEGRMIYYSVANDDGDVDGEETSFVFKGHGLKDLTINLVEETGLENIIVCSRNPLNGKLYPLRLALPPNNTTMHIVVVPSTSEAAREFLPAST